MGPRYQSCSFIKASFFSPVYQQKNRRHLTRKPISYLDYELKIVTSIWLIDWLIDWSIHSFIHSFIHWTYGNGSVSLVLDSTKDCLYFPVEASRLNIRNGKKYRICGSSAWCSLNVRRSMVPTLEHSRAFGSSSRRLSNGSIHPEKKIMHLIFFWPTFLGNSEVKFVAESL
jgi:hypothetical protein